MPIARSPEALGFSADKWVGSGRRGIAGLFNRNRSFALAIRLRSITIQTNRTRKSALWIEAKCNPRRIQ